MVKNSSIQILNPGKVVERLLKPSVNFSEKNIKQTQCFLQVGFVLVYDHVHRAVMES